MSQSFLPDTLKNRVAAFGQSLVPTSLWMPGFAAAPCREVVVRSFPPSASEREALIQASRGWLPVGISLGPGLVHSQSLLLPRRAAAEAADAIRLMLRQKMPAQAAGLAWTFERIGRQGGEIDCRVHVCKEALVTDLVLMVEGFGGRVRTVSLEGSSAPPLLDARASTDRPVRAWAGTALAVVLGLAVVSVGVLEVRASRLRSATEELSVRLAGLEEEAVLLRDAASARAETADALHTELARFTAGANRLRLLADLALALPDTAWLSEIDIQGTTARLSGLSSADVPTVMDAVRAVEGVASVDLDGPVLFDSFSGQNRFGLLVRLASEEVRP